MKHLSIYDFNQKRNCFELDKALELDMFEEEVKEFFDATTTAERVDAFVDVDYVFKGTEMKCVRNMQVIPETLVKIHDSFVSIALDILSDELGENLGAVLENAVEIVCLINAKKVSELDENGKVVKQKDLPNATEYIADMLSTEFGIE